VGERGLKLSGGERQRIAIARALYADPAIVLLDEASSALDAETEKAIMDQLRLIRDEVTIIAITHRLSVIAPDDRVVKIGVEVSANS
jgi:ABC-type bacteriocin/lantibiotic exporter with double-glycine peptidase domain